MNDPTHWTILGKGRRIRSDQHNFQAATPMAQAGNKVQTESVALAKRDGFKVCSIP